MLYKQACHLIEWPELCFSNVNVIAEFKKLPNFMFCKQEFIATSIYSMKKVVFLGSMIFVVAACNSDAEIKDLRGTDVSSSLVSSEQSQKELEESLSKIRQEEEEKERLAEESRTTLEFDKLIHDFGNVKPEVENKTVFRVKNTGTKPLIIENVEASCGCTTPKKPEKPILPGDSDEIEVSFKSNPGQTGEQDKTVTVTANTAERLHKLEIRAFVK